MIIDNIVIVACGKGKRLMPLTSNIPKILVNINNDNILHKLVDYWKYYCKNFIVVVDQEYNTLIEFSLNQYDEIKYEIRNLEIKNDEENSYTISHTLTNLDTKNLLITWCDIYPTEMIDFSKISNNCIFTNSFSNYTSRYYAKENKTIEKMTDYNKGNIVGIYLIKNFKRLIYENPKQDLCDCFINNYKEFQTYELSKIVDIGDFEKLNSHINSETFSTRYFNEIKKIGNNKLIKKSVNSYGDKIIKNEINFYKFLKENNIEYPMIKIDNIKNNSFEMEYLNNDTVYQSLLKYNNPDIIKNLIYFLKKLYLSNIKEVDNKIILNDLRLETIDKILTRNNFVKSILNNFDYISYVDNIKIESYEKIMEKLEFRINKFTSKNKKLFYNLLHGDLNLSNIFEDNNDFIFIDPRGSFGESKMYGLKYYELGKIYFSLFGFDKFNTDTNYFFNIIGDNINTNISNLMNEIYIYNDIYTNEEYEFIICLGVSIWLGLPYYLKNNISKMIGAHFYSLYLGTIYLDSIENLLHKNYVKQYLNTNVIIKNSQKNIKSYNEKIKNFELRKQPFKTYRDLVVKKPWGFEFICLEFEDLTLLVLHIKKNEGTSLHTHIYKDTPMILAQGKLSIQTLNNEYNVNVGDIVILNKGIFHKLCSHSDDTIVLEWEMLNPNKNDLLRLKDKYSRESKGYEGKTDTIYNARLNCPEYFEYYEDSSDLEHHFLNNKINFKKGDLHDSIKNKLITDNTIIVIIKGFINLEGKYLNSCSMIRGKELLNKNFICEGEDFRYFLFN